VHRFVRPDLDLELVGAGRAFEETGFALPRQRLALDGGWGRQTIFAQPTLFVSHLHLDHAQGIARYVVNRQKMGDGRCRILVPAAALTHAQDIVAAAQRAEGRADAVEWVGLAAGDTVPLEGRWRLRALDAVHGIPAIGCLLERETRRVRPRYAGLPSAEIGALVRSGEQPIESVWEPLFAYTGDSEVAMLDANPILYAAAVLLVECTFVDALHPDGPPVTPGHIHWEELCARAERFCGGEVLLTHFSKRYAPGELWRALDRTCPPNLRRHLRPLIGIRGTDDRSD
jgi:ribonuclease BN (tRNA processing enzyme)